MQKKSSEMTVMKQVVFVSLDKRQMENLMKQVLEYRHFHGQLTG